jgi:hypothetical protein
MVFVIGAMMLSNAENRLSDALVYNFDGIVFAIFPKPNVSIPDCSEFFMN